MKVYAAEHPNPQWEREKWISLNGEWGFEFDFGKSAIDREIYKETELKNRIIVPFCPESELSGVKYMDFIPAVCYMKNIEVGGEDLENRVIIHFGAVDYRAVLYINGEFVGEHRGGYTPFEFDITDKLKMGKNTLFLYAEDDVRNGKQCAGKQSDKQYSYGCSYTRTTGIWQSVWLEFVPENHIKFAKYYTDISTATVTVIGEVCGAGQLRIETSYEGKPTGDASIDVNGFFAVRIPLSEKHLWEIGNSRLYDISFTFGDDFVKSYFGLREISIDKNRILLNGKSVFQRLVLDQGYYKKGIYTAPSDEELQKDIVISMNAGFNGARLHQKVFEPRFLYHADRQGYIVWGEYPNWGLKIYDDANVLADILSGWSEVIDRDFNHPSIICWCPFNETWLYNEHETGGRLLKTIYSFTKKADPTRPCIDTSGHYHVITDIYDIHDYTQDIEKFSDYFRELGESGDFDYNGTEEDRAPFFQRFYKYKKDMPVIISEYGGIKWDIEAVQDISHTKSWGYGIEPETEEEFLQRYRGLTECLLANKNICGFCYTQLYDVEQEKNGLYTYERESKFDIGIIKEINSRKAAIEKE
jgi:beta-galactosidase/beta-glucuronidase